MKRILAILIPIIVVLAAGYYFFLRPGSGFSGDAPAFRAVPIDAPVFVEFKSLKDLPAENEAVSGLIRSGILNDFFEISSQIDTKIQESEALGNALRNIPFIVALNLEGRDEVIPLIILKMESSKRKKELESIISGIFPSDKNQYSSRQYNGEKIFEIKNNNAEEVFTYSYTHGLLIASPASLVIEKSIRQLETQSLPDNTVFKEVQKTATQQALASIYLNHTYFAELSGLITNSETHVESNEFGEEIRVNFKNILSRFSGFASWSELDLFADDEEIQMSGISLAPDSLFQYLTVFRGQDPVKMQIDNVMPRNTALYYSIGFSKKKTFFDKQEEYFQHSSQYYKREEKLKRISTEIRSDLQPVFEDLAEDEVALAFSDISGEAAEKTEFFMVSVKARGEAREKMLQWLQQYASRKNTEFEKLTSHFSIDQETTYDIYNFPYPSFPGIWMGQPFTSTHARYLTFWDNYMLFSNKRSSLENLLYDLTLGATLAKDPTYETSRKKMENKANISFYMDVNNAYNLNKAFFTEKMTDLFKEKDEELRKFSSVNWQVINSNQLFFNNIILEYSGKIEEDAKTTWQSNIGSPVDFKPQLVLNHDDPSNLEIIVQDLSNRLHLITSEGRVRWTIEIPGKILGEIFQVDYYRNGKLQFLFNTKNKIYLIDRLGNNVSPFPVALRSPATNGLNVFDYDNNRNYRYFVAGEDKKIYAYDRDGKIVSGWEFEKTDHEVTTPVQHFRVANKDYIVFKDKTKVYIQDRRGNTRVKPDVNFENSQNPIILNTTDKAKMVATDVKGNVYYLYFDGTHSLIETAGYTSGHYFTIEDIDGNNTLDFIFIDENKLTVSDENNRKIFEEEFRNDIHTQANVYTFSSSLKKIGVVDKTANRIYLYNPDGSLHKGFPLHGNSEFTIGRITSGTTYLNLVVGSSNGDIYNYRLD